MISKMVTKYMLSIYLVSMITVHEISLYQSLAAAKVLEMIIRSSLSSQDVHILGHTEKTFYENLLKFLTQVKDNQSQHYQPNEYVFHRLIGCTQRVTNDHQDGCPVIFDSWSCFNSTSSGSFQTEPCPEFETMAFSLDRLASKYCDVEGEWWVHPSTNRTWSNYTECVDF